MNEELIIDQTSVTELTEKFDGLVQVLTEQIEMEQKEKAEEEKLLLEQQEQQEQQALKEAELLATESETIEEWRENLLNELQLLNQSNTEMLVYFEETKLHQAKEMELYSMVYYAAMLIIIFGCLIPVLWIVKQFKTILNWFT